MEFTIQSPIKYNVRVISGSIITCEFKIKGTKIPIKLNIELHVYFKHNIRSNMTDVVTSDVQSIKTSKEDTIHKIKIKVPEFKDCIQSFIVIHIDRSVELYTKAFLEYIKIDVGNLPQQVELTQLEQIQSQQVLMHRQHESLGQKEFRQSLEQMRTQQFLTSRQELLEQKEPRQSLEQINLGQSPIIRQEPLRQSIADQLRASTIIPNIRPKMYTSAPVDIFTQCTIPRSDAIKYVNMGNDNIQDIQAIQRAQIEPLNIVSKIIGKGLKTINGKKIVIASIIRNEEENGNLIKFLDCCQKLETYHDNIVYIFIEGDSSDKTYDILKNWIETRDGSILEKIDMDYGIFPKNRDLLRTVYFARLRNRLVEHIISISNVEEIFMIDANYEWDEDIISQLRETDSDISAPLTISHKDSKGRYVFYDIWVFRKDGIEFWPFYPYAENMEFDKPTNVDSVGGGYLIKKKVLDAGVIYSGDTDSEQVGFCNNARKLGFNIKINPSIYIKKCIPIDDDNTMGG